MKKTIVTKNKSKTKQIKHHMTIDKKQRNLQNTYDTEIVLRSNLPNTAIVNLAFKRKKNFQVGFKRNYNKNKQITHTFNQLEDSQTYFSIAITIEYRD